MGIRVTIRRVATAWFAVALTAGVLALSPAPAGAVQVPQPGRVVSDDPVNWTPHALDGRVNAIAQVGDTVYMGGTFTQVRSATDSTVLSRAGFMAFDANTGAIRPLAPQFDGEVTTILAAPDGQSLYVGGRFSRLGTQTSRSLARISTATGAPVPGFTVPTLNGAVRDLRLVGGRLWLAGGFTHVAGVAQPFLATINATTGARDPYAALAFAGVQQSGSTQILKIDVTPDGSRLFAIGNFATVAGQPNEGMVAIDLTGPTAALADWRTTFYESVCSASFDTYMRDLDISPDGRFVVVTTTGAYGGGPPRACDTHARFEVRAQGTVAPTWVNYTGGDTTYAVAVTGDVVYAGGHFRWANNPFAGDTPGPGAVSRPGLVALDPDTGLPLSWNPTRTLGVGVFDIVSTPTGLWVGSDTDRFGDFEFHGRLAFFPLAGGTALPADQEGRFPGRLHLLDPAAVDNAVQGRFLDGTTVGPLQTFPNGGVNWDAARAAVMIDGTVYAAFGDAAGSFVARTFDGTTWGPADPVDSSDQLVVDSNWHNDVRNMTGLFFDDGRLYYTVAGQASLFYRYFNTESQVVGAQRFTASGSVTGLSFSTVRGLFVGGNSLYWTTTDGSLRRIGWTGTAPISGTAQGVSGPTVDGVDWRARAVFLFTGVVPGTNQAPTAAATVTCSGLDCAADGTASTDADGTVTAWSWDFGDGTAPVTGSTAAHAYAAGGTYTVTLTVTDNLGATATTSRSVTVEAVTTSIQHVGSASSNANATTHRVTIPAAVQAGDALLLFATSNSTSTPPTAPTGGGTWTLVSSVGTDGMTTSLWRATATGPGGGSVQLTTSAIAKVAVSVLAYRGTAANPVAAVAQAAETTSRATHTTPTASAAGGGQWAVSYWAQEDSTSTALTPAAGVTTRTTSVGTGGGRVLSAAADSGAPIGAGSYGGRVATATAASRHATMWTVVLAPAATGPVVDGPPTAVAAVSCSGLSCVADGSASSDAEAPVASYSWNFGDGSPAAVGVGATHSYGAPGTYTVTLTVTDSAGATATDTEQVTVAPPAAVPISFVGAGASNVSGTSFQVALPAGVAAGDGLLLFASSNNPAATLSPPSGGGAWTLVDTVGTDSLVTSLWKASAAGPGTVSVTANAAAKVGLTVLAYRGTAADPVAAVARAAETTSRADHVTPGVAVGAGGWVVSYWSHKDSTSASLTPAAGVTARSTSVGTGSGRVLTAVADSAGPVGAATDGPRAATATAASRHATMWSVALAPA